MQQGRALLSLEMEQGLDEDLLLEDDAAMEEASLREAGIMPVEHDDEVCELL